MTKAIIIAAPSGSGKTSIVKQLLKLNKGLKFSVSATTRKIRKNEIDGVDYHFLNLDEFKSKINNDDLFEYQEVYEGLYYGTLKSELQKIWQGGSIVLFDVDVIGGINLKKSFGQDALSVFIKPPSLEVLKQRLVDRNTESQESLNIRLQKAESEIQYQFDYDCIIVNDDFNAALLEIDSKVKNFLNLKINYV